VPSSPIVGEVPAPPSPLWALLPMIKRSNSGSIEPLASIPDGSTLNFKNMVANI